MWSIPSFAYWSAQDISIALFAATAGPTMITTK